MAASVTLLPALLGFAGRNIERLHVPFVSKDLHAYDTSRWYRWSRFVQRRPWVAAIGGLAVLLALAAPFLGIRLGFPDAQNDPPSVHHPPGLRPARRRVRSRLLGAAAAHRPGALGRRRCCRRRRARRPAAPRSTASPRRPAGRPQPGRRHRGADAGRPPPPPRTRPPRTWSTRCATTSSRPPSRAPASPSTSAGWWPPTSTSPAAWPTGCRSSSAACCWCRSCC